MPCSLSLLGVTKAKVVVKRLTGAVFLTGFFSCKLSRAMWSSEERGLITDHVRFDNKCRVLIIINNYLFVQTLVGNFAKTEAVLKSFNNMAIKF